MSKKKKRKKIILQLEDGFHSYSCDLLNDDILSNINLTQEDIEDVKFTFRDMPGYLYSEGIPLLGNVTVGGGSLGVGIYTHNKGDFEIQPFMRYDKGHKQGFEKSHLNPKLRLISPNKRVTYLPDKSTKYDVFGDKMPELFVLSYPILWTCFNPDDETEFMEVTIKEKKKKRQQRKKP